MDSQIYQKITSKKEFSELPLEDVERVWKLFEKRETSEEDKIKLARDLLRKIYFAFGSLKLLNRNILDKKTSEDILKKHISTKERFEYYNELYSKILPEFKGSVIDLGAGINGLSHRYLPKEVYYLGVEAVGQLVELMNYFFKKQDIQNAKAVHGSLFDLEKIKKLIKETKGEKIVFLFKTIDSLEMTERDSSKVLLKEIVPLVNRIVVSFATKSLISQKDFKVKRYWFENFVKEEFKVLNDFELGGERYIIFKKK